jgi:hypothetical protein
MSLYLMSAWGEGQQEKWLRERWAKAGKKLDMGKCCIRFRKVEDLALDVIGEFIRRSPAKAYVRQYESQLATMKTRSPKAAAKPARAAKRGAAAPGRR